MVTWPLNCFILRLVEGKIWFDKAVWTSVFQLQKPKDNIYSPCLSSVSVSFLYFDKWCRFWCSCAGSTVFNSCGRVFKSICSLEDVCSWKVGHVIFISTGVGFVCVCVLLLVSGMQSDICLHQCPTMHFNHRTASWRHETFHITWWPLTNNHMRSLSPEQSITQHIHGVVLRAVQSI